MKLNYDLKKKKKNPEVLKLFAYHRVSKAKADHE